jgi:hypothetical protein
VSFHESCLTRMEHHLAEESRESLPDDEALVTAEARQKGDEFAHDIDTDTWPSIADVSPSVGGTRTQQSQN